MSSCHEPVIKGPCNMGVTHKKIRNKGARKFTWRRTLEKIKLSQFLVKRHGLDNLDNTRGKLNDYRGTAHAQGDFKSFRATFN